MNTYLTRVLHGLKARNAHEPELLQAAQEMLAGLSPVFNQKPEHKRNGFLKASEGIMTLGQVY